VPEKGDGAEIDGEVEGFPGAAGLAEYEIRSEDEIATV